MRISSDNILRMDKAPNKRYSKWEGGPVSKSHVVIEGDVDPATREMVAKMVEDVAATVKSIEANPNFQRFYKDRVIGTLTYGAYNVLMDLENGYIHAHNIDPAKPHTELDEVEARRWRRDKLIWDDEVDKIFQESRARGKPQFFPIRGKPTLENE